MRFNYSVKLSIRRRSFSVSNCISFTDDVSDLVLIVKDDK